ncbi:hypothetical protein [Amycolatopsis tolypomycina]|uniref:hypothetical protein n=1 Tax=Amycolatopsis tolypomycina TaxID=208445 RepID=UPI0033BA06DD
MTAATIYLDPARIQPVIDGEWHRVTSIPLPGEEIITLCGARGTVEFDVYARRNDGHVATMCAGCDREYRRALGIPAQARGRA